MSFKVDRVPENIDFPKEEENILKFWQDIDAFQSSLKQSKGKPRYSFYDGPPFATGLPHYGHILAGTIKDVVTRYAHQQGYHVERRFGWDTHGLPVEFEIDKLLGIKGPDDVAKMGIDKYNAECRKIVMRYSNDWERIITRMGRWIDFKNDYKTLYPWFMESIWWVFKEIYNKGLVYQGVKVMPYSTACSTPLSNFESGQNYKDVVDPAVVVSFPTKEGYSLLAWTTTPWTLPSNLALCVNPNLVYLKIKEKSTGTCYVLQESRLPVIFKNVEDFEILEKFPGSKLKGVKYEPLFDYFVGKCPNAYQVLNDGYVTDDSGTGIVHQAPYFGEDDYRVCVAAGVVTRDQDIICPVDASGRFMEPVKDFLGQHVKDADKNIIALLKSRNRLIQSGQIKHSYPFCWRSETPLIYKAVPSWFIRVEQMSQDLLKSSGETYWVPDFVKDKRFGNWLKEARDWAVSRNRYWGTPIPLWMSSDKQEVVCIGSIAELEALTGTKVTDLHRESIDHLEIPSSRPGQPPLKRVSEVFDCWFESGSMPYAQCHYPFENKKEFEEKFPADFIAEGIDQTRGWFYTLIVISTALFNKPPFKNLIANGLVLASDGQKMSKRKKNYPDPLEVVHKYGADALRLYLVNSPVVRAENLRFKEEGVRDIIKDVFLPWYNAFRFLMQNVERTVQEDKVDYRFNEKAVRENVMDRWITSFTQSLIQFVKKEMAAYRLYTVVPRLTKFIDHLTNWYVRMNRKRLKGENGVKDCQVALDTLFGVLFDMARVMAPFTPFLTELMYKTLRQLLPGKSLESVHFNMTPEPKLELVDTGIERAVQRMQAVIELGRVLRDRKTIPIKYPLPEMIIIHRDQTYLDDVSSLEKYVLEEMNVRKLQLTSDKEKYGITLRAEPDHKILGARLKGDFKAVTQGLKDLNNAQCEKLIADGFVELVGQKIDVSEVRIIFQAQGTDQYEAHSDNDVLVLLNVSPDQDMLDEGFAREIINRVQKLRKKAHLVPTDEVNVYYSVAKTSDIGRIIQSHREFIESTVKAPMIPGDQLTPSKAVVIEETQELKGSQLKIVITWRKEVELPSNAWANIVLQGLTPRYGVTTTKASILLKDNTGKFITLDRLHKEIENLFGIYGMKYSVWCNGAEVKSVSDLNAKTIVVAQTKPKDPESASTPFCKFVNIANGAKSATLFLENPIGKKSLTVDQAVKLLADCLGMNEKDIDKKLLKK
ncbi:Isoleucine--tRNA ligase-cytoplasmic [Plutella xylostella]|uniref:isoleucine--tRNA ligase n=1 Tax=Plutella xylostella TaxID=51655 RepID=A0ABQ7Q4J8_PLUXY|nr:isoleucine--tRNA ligase, cytoplasmic [Plutella xylostella]KAG7300162.1 Isoleucine--tRNA ligase-cytoplasmic [Plutella xylostella]